MLPEDSLLDSLISDERIIVTPHIAFYTEEAVEQMVKISIENLKNFENDRTVLNEF